MNIDKDADNSKAQKKIESYFKKGLDDAARKAHKFAPKFTNEVSSVLEEVAYGVGYVPGFIGALAQEFLPEKVQESLNKGMSEGGEKAMDVAQKGKAAASSQSSKEGDEKYAPPTSS